MRNRKLIALDATIGTKPNKLIRIVSTLRDRNGTFSNTTYVGTDEEAREHCEWISQRGAVLAISEFKLVKEQEFEPCGQKAGF